MKNIDKKKICTLVLFALCFFSCDEIIKIVIPDDPDPEPVVQVPVSLRSFVQDGEFVKGDCVGVYMSTYMDGKHVDLKAKGNHVDNNKFQYDGAGNVKADGLIQVWLDDKCGLIDDTGKTVLPCQHSIEISAGAFDEEIKIFSDGIVFRKDGKMGIVDLKGNVIAPPVYDIIISNTMFTTYG